MKLRLAASIVYKKPKMVTRAHERTTITRVDVIIALYYYYSDNSTVEWFFVGLVMNFRMLHSKKKYVYYRTLEISYFSTEQF
jgi:hypothetical protein